MRRLLSFRWLLFHVMTVGLTAAFLALGWWQLRRAEAGNTLSIGYTAQWPLFAAFAVFMWFKVIRHELSPEKDEAGQPSGHERQSEIEISATSMPAAEPSLSEAPAALSPSTPHEDESAEDEELAAYNRYLAWLNSRSESRSSRSRYGR